MIERRIVGFRQDADQEWIAELECGHAQHVRHTPPWQLHPWVVTPEGRAMAYRHAATVPPLYGADEAALWFFQRGSLR